MTVDGEEYCFKSNGKKLRTRILLAKEKPATSIQAENAAILETHNIVNFQDLISSTLSSTEIP